jgi:hypothetical protein
MVPPEENADPEVASVAEIVPARAVLTELARGFLLEHQSNPGHAVRFAEGFLREQAGRPAPPRMEPLPHVSLARLSLGRTYRGAVEPSGLPPGP